ncbi:LPS assembly lipoprotein LptE [Muricoccus radiodurans]|uniref:LPS assembly lipoprotein LptE n=1 Tax=Muricoccus radiodurans TaxID=2231721 RepID=UPI003CEA3D2B
MDRTITRRGLLGGTGLLLAGCGFRPLHAPPAEVGADVQAELAAIRVGMMPNRRGQMMRQILQGRLERPGTAARYELRVAVLPGSSLQGYRRDGSPSRVSLNYTAPWSLVTLAVPPVMVASGTARAFDDYNIPDNEFFAGLQSADAADRRLLEQIADDIVLRLTLTFRERPAA